MKWVYVGFAAVCKREGGIYKMGMWSAKKKRQ